MSIHKLICPSCGINHIVKNGTIHNKKQKYQCQNCQRQFVENSQRDYNRTQITLCSLPLCCFSN